MTDRYPRDKSRVSLVVGGQVYDGWLQCEVRRSIEALAGVFTVPVSLVPGQPVPIKRQDVVELRIGQTPVVQGYVLAAEPFYRRNDVGLRVSGRDRTGDLVRCSAVHQGGQWRRASLQRIAQDLVAPFGLQVVTEVDTGAPIQDFRIGHAETVLDALARAARLRGVLVTTGSQGNLLLTRAGLKRFDGAIRRGWNVIEMEGLGTDEDRPSANAV